MSSPGSPSADPSLYSFSPSLPLALLGAACFVAVMLVHMWQLVLHPAWHFWAMYVGLFMECVGFGARVVSVHSPTKPTPFIVSYLAPILAPSFIAAACYATFGRIVWWVTPPEGHRVRVLWCPTRFVTPLFVLFDLGSFLIQLLGAGAVGTAYSSEQLEAPQRQERASTGLLALRVGLGLQMACFGAFAVVSSRFLFVSRCWVHRPARCAARPGANWRRLAWTINVSATAFIARAIYRLIEFSGSRSQPSYVLRHEWPLWVFDALPMLVVSVLFTLTHPSWHLPQEFLRLRLAKRKLRNYVESLPPSYLQSGLTRVDGQSRG